MELFLNFVWVMLAGTLLWQWLRCTPAEGSDRRMQLVSLVVLIFILLPAISMTDDLLAAQNPAEVDCCLRRDHDYTNPHSIFPAVSTPPLPAFSGPSFQVAYLIKVNRLPHPVTDSPARAAVQNRPPPAA
jgi:hypothetical protein